MNYNEQRISIWRKRGIKLSKFYVVGAIAFTFEALILTLNGAFFDAEPYIVRIFSLPAASVITWILNRKFTFRSKNPKKMSQYRLVLLNNGISQTANYLIFFIISGFVPAILFSSEVTALLIAAASTSMYNFLIGNYFIFRQ